MEHEAFVTTVMAVVALLFLASVSAVVTKRIRFPYTIGLVLIGVAVAFIADDYPALAHALDAFKLEPVMIMFLFIPILIFESAFNMDVPVLMRNLVAVTGWITASGNLWAWPCSGCWKKPTRWSCPGHGPVRQGKSG